MLKLNKTRSSVLLLAVCLLLSALLSGCGDPEEAAEPVNIAMLVSICDGERCLDLDIPELARLPELSGSTYSFIVPEGTPTVLASGTVPMIDESYTDVMRKRMTAGIAADFQEKFESYRPASPQLDLGAAIDLAVRQLRASQAEGRQNILVLSCSGRSSIGMIDLVQTPAFQLDVGESASAVAKSLCADLSFLDAVVWYGIGECGGGTQAALSPKEKQTLRDFYQGLFAEMGLQHEIDFRERPADSYYTFSMQVTPMPVEGIASGLIACDLAPEVFEPVPTPKEEIVLRLDDGSVAFRPDEAILLDPESAVDALRPFAEYLLENEGQVLLAGSTATAGSPEGCMTLSKRRAQTVADLLIQRFGVPESKLLVVGLGQAQTSLREADVDADGHLIESAAVKNRCVYIVLLPSEVGAELLHIGD